MQSLLPIINKLSAIGVVLFFLLSLVILVLTLTRKRYKLTDFIKKYILQITFVISLISVLMSLYYSDVIGFAPCMLCWYQRIFLYPLVPLLGLAIWKRDHWIINYAMLLSSLGFLIAVYHNLVYYFNIAALPCPADGPSCIQHFVSELGGFVSIPMMSLSVFTLLLVLMISAKYSAKNG